MEPQTKEQRMRKEERREWSERREEFDRIRSGSGRRCVEGRTGMWKIGRMRVLEMSKKKVNTDLLGEASSAGKRQITNFLCPGEGELSLFVLGKVQPF